MKLRLPLVGLVIAFPCLYYGALGGSTPVVLVGLLIVAAVCVWLLVSRAQP